MCTNRPTRRQRREPRPDVTPDDHDHRLIAVDEWRPGAEPDAPEADRSADPPSGSRTRFWRCRRCGQERSRRSAFPRRCVAADRSPPLAESGYAIDEPRTRRALTERMTVRFGERGPTYQVDSESGNTYEVDSERLTCTCPDHQRRDVTCKHLRRVDIAIRAGAVPQPNGTFRRTSRDPESARDPRS